MTSINVEKLLGFAMVAWLNIITPGPAVMLAIRNGISYGARIAVYASAGNACGVFLIAASTMLGLDVLLMSSVWLFRIFKFVGAAYLFYLGVRHLIGRVSIVVPKNETTAESEKKAPIAENEAAAPVKEVVASNARYKPITFFREALLLAVTNPNPILFFTALFPQFIVPNESLVMQFFVFTGIFVILAFLTMIGYIVAAHRVRLFLAHPRYVVWVNRAIGCVFIAYGTMLLFLQQRTVAS